MYKTEGKENMDVSFSNFSNLSFGYDSSLYFALSKIVQDAY